MADLSELENAIEALYEYIENPTKRGTLEIEGRFGIISSDQHFDSNIGKAAHDKINQLLESCQEWVSKKEIHTREYTHKHLRLKVDAVSGEPIECIEKRCINKFDYVLETLPMDFRININEEIPHKVSEFPKRLDNLYCREKIRKRFSLEKYHFDLTEVIETQKECIAKTYEYEIEYANPDGGSGIGHERSTAANETDPEDIIYNIVYKLFDANMYFDHGFVRTKDTNLDFSKHVIKSVTPLKDSIRT
jgi:hypothetical protein